MASSFSTPSWRAPRNGTTNDAWTQAQSTHVNQFLGTHALTATYQGAVISPNTPVTTFTYGTPAWGIQLGQYDYYQPFTLSGTANLGRISVPLLCVGNGADLLVSMWQGVPGVGTLLRSVRVPAAWIKQLSAVTAVPGATEWSAGPTTYTGSPLATGAFNTWHASQNIIANTLFSTSNVSLSAATTYYATGTSGVIIQCGGSLLTSGGSSYAAATLVNFIPYDASGVLSSPVVQASLPVTNDGTGAAVVATDSSTGGPVVVLVGGAVTASANPTNTVYTASISTTSTQTSVSSTTQFTLSNWSAQTVYPANVQAQGMGAGGSFVYSVGGRATTAGSATAAVYYAQVTNGQIAAWKTGTPLPVALLNPNVAVSNGYLIVTGGGTGSLSTVSYYAPINATTGAIGSWILVNSGVVQALVDSQPTFSNAYGVIAGNANSVLGVDALGGPAPVLITTSNSNAATIGAGGYLDTGDGNVWCYAVGQVLNNNPAYVAFQMNLALWLSIPMPVTGLTFSTTYTIALQQLGGDLANYLCSTFDTGTVLGAATYGTRGAFTWGSTVSGGNGGIPIQLYDQTVPATPRFPLHTWEDSGVRLTTLVQSNTPDRRLLGVCEATRRQTALNQNQGFEFNLNPWTVSGGTAVQSTTQVFSGSHSCQVTPSGSASSVTLTSEMIPCEPGETINDVGWLWFTNAVTSNASVSISWYTSSSTLISTSSNAVSVGAASWTQLSNSFTAPTGSGTVATQFQIVVTLSGTPSASNVFYVDNAYAYRTLGDQFTAVGNVTWSSTWPTTPNFPTGITQLA